jgi:hypothetical protein
MMALVLVRLYIFSYALYVKNLDLMSRIEVLGYYFMAKRGTSWRGHSSTL